ncbi:MAG: pyridoxal-phosphate dependent enzyme [Chitinophagaceae bacterium]
MTRVGFMFIVKTAGEIKVNSPSRLFYFTMQDIQPGNITTDKILIPAAAGKKITVSVLRLDKIHPLLSGNKWFKLRYYLKEAKEQNKKKIVTWGGAWSNHILATAAACQLQDLCCTGLIRGEEAKSLSRTLVLAKESGMELVFLSRSDYQDKKLPAAFNGEDYFTIPEGGYGFPGVKGAATILDFVTKEEYTHICCAAGTGTMLAGLLQASAPANHITGISVLKNNRELEKKIDALVPGQKKSFTILHDYHFGGYAKHPSELLAFMNSFYQETTIPTDIVYTGKLFYAVNDLIQIDFFGPGSNLLIIHSGGLQGNVSLDKGTLIF